MQKSFHTFLFLLLASLLAAQTPRLVVPLGHPQGIRSLAFSPDGKMVLTGGMDGVMKQWDSKGREIQAFDGTSTVFSIAFSPDGKTVLTGCADNTAKLWNLEGKKIQSFIGHDYWVQSVAFSPDGKTVLTGSADGTAKLWDLAGRVIQTFDMRSDGVTAVRAVAFSPDGKMVLAGGGELEGRYGKAKLWDLAGKEIQAFAGLDGEVNAVAFSPDGQTVLTGSGSGAKLWNLKGREIQTFTGHGSWVQSVAFSPDSKTVLTGSADGTAKLWNLKGIEIQSFTGHGSWVQSAAFSPDGKTVLTSSEREAKLWDLTGREIQTFIGHTCLVSNVTFSSDGKSVLTGREIYTVTGRRNLTPMRWNLTDAEAHLFIVQADSAYAFSVISFIAHAPDGNTILAGGFDGTVKLKDLEGREIQSFVGHTAYVGAVAFSPNGKVVLTGSWDGTAKLWDLAGQELATLIVLDSADWVVTTPSGLFDASPGAMRLMHYVVGTEAVELEQLKERYYEPGLLAKITGHSQEPLRSVVGLDTVGLYPTVTLELDTLKNILHIRLDERSGGVGKVSVFVNGKEIVEDANLPKGGSNVREKAFSIDLELYERFFLPDALNSVTVRAYSADNWLKSAPHELRYVPDFTRAKGGDGQPPARGAAPERSSRRPALHIILVGTADYAGTALDLKYAAKDAADMASALKQTGELLFKPGNVTVHLLSTDPGQTPPTKANIKAAFDAVEKASKAEDILITYFSGHGITYGDADRALFYYLTMDIATPNLSDAGIRTTRAISSNELTEWTKKIPALKQVMILDACNSGKVAETILAAGEKSLASTQIRALDRMKDRTGMFVLTGSAADMVSYEAGRFGQSLLTYSLLVGISGFDLDDKTVDVMKLFQGARDRVPNLAAEIGGIQTPMMAFPVGAASFPIGIVDETIKIELQQPKPVFIRNVFLDEERFDDPLGFTEEIENLFREKTAKGGSAELVFVDVKQFTNAYSIKGLYKVHGNTVTLRGRLFKGATPVGEAFQVSGNKNELPFLADDVWEKVRGLVK